MAYATLADYRATPGVPAVPDDAALQQHLQDASDRVDELLIAAVYPVDADGMPTTAGVAAALRSATIRQTAALAADPNGAADTGPAGPMTLGPLTLPAVSGSEQRYSRGATQVLAAAGLISTQVLGW